jgi:TonB family protein
MLSKRDGDDLLKGLAGPDTDWEEALVAEGLDAAAAAAIAGTTREDVLQRLLDLLHASKQERGETGDLARQLREDLQAAEAEIRRLEAESTALAAERQQQALSALSEKSGRAEQSVKHAQEIAVLRQSLQQATADAEAKDAALRELRLELQERESAMGELSARQTALEQQASQEDPAIAEAQARARELMADLAAERTAAAETLAAARSDAEARLEKLRREHGDALGALRTHHAGEIADLRRQQEDAQSEQSSAQYAALKKASEDRWARMQQTQEETRRQFEAKLSAQQARQAEVLEDARREHAAAIEGLEAKLWAEKAQALLTAKTEWEGKIERMRRENAQIADLLNEEHRLEVESLSQSHAQALAIRDQELAEAHKRAAATPVPSTAPRDSADVFANLEQLRGQIEQQYRTQLDDLAKRDHEAFDAAARKHKAALQDQAERFALEKAQALAAQKAKSEAELARVRGELSAGVDELAIVGAEAERNSWEAERSRLLVEQSSLVEEKTRLVEQQHAMKEQLSRILEAHAHELGQVHEMHRHDLEALQESNAQELAAHSAAPAADDAPTTSIRLDRLKNELVREHLAEIEDLKTAQVDAIKGAVQEQVAQRNALEASLRDEKERARAAEERLRAAEVLAEEKLEKLRRANAQLTAALDEQEQKLAAAARGGSLPPPRNPKSTIPPPPLASVPASTPPLAGTLSGVTRKDLDKVVPRPLNPKATIAPVAAVPPAASAHPPAAATHPPVTATNPPATAGHPPATVAHPPVAAPPAPPPRETLVRETPREHPPREKEPSEHSPTAAAPSSLGLGASAARRGPARSRLPMPLLAGAGVVGLAVLAIVGFMVTRQKAAPAPDSVATEAPVAATAAPATAAPATPAPMSVADFTSKPDGADVAIAGNAVGQTPLLDYEVRAGSHAVTMTKPGYERWTGTAVVEAGKKATVFAELHAVGAPAAAAPATTAAPAAVEKEYLENEVDVAPKPVAGAPVVFPESEVSAQKPGSMVSVTVAFLIGADGSVSKVEIVGSGGKGLDVAALSAIGRWRFSPGQKQGKPVKVRMTRKFSFKF